MLKPFKKYNFLLNEQLKLQKLLNWKNSFQL